MTATLGLGAGTIISAGYGPVSEAAAESAVEAAYQAGIRFFDTAEFYGSGRSEEIIGRVLGRRLAEVTISTKGGVRYRDPSDLTTLVRDCSYDSLRRSLEGSLRRLGAQRVDYLLLHQCDFALTPEQQMENLSRLVEAGLTGKAGFCNFGPEECRRALATGIPAAVEYSCSLLDRRYVGELEAAGAAGCRRITFGTYVHGLLAERFRADHDFGPDDWRGASRRTGRSGTSGNVFFAGDAFGANVALAARLADLGSDLGLTPAAFAVALTVRLPETDTVLVGCRNAGEVQDAVAGAAADLPDAVVASVDALLATAQRPTRNLLGSADVKEATTS